MTEKLQPVLVNVQLDQFLNSNIHKVVYWHL